MSLNSPGDFLLRTTDQSILCETSVGEIIEDYPDDKSSPSCLILGLTQGERPIHIHCSYPSRLVVIVITVYEPNSAEWIEFRVRR